MMSAQVRSQAISHGDGNSGFDRQTRNSLARMVGQVRERLRTDITDQIRRLGFQEDGTVLDLDAIAGLAEGDLRAGLELHALLDHFIALESGVESHRRQAAFDRLVREIGFTTFNRLVALRMAEERGLIVQSAGRGLASDGFQLYERIANGALGNRVEVYRAYLECLYDEIAQDLPLLFDRGTPESRIFPSERCIEDVLELLNTRDLVEIWKQDEAIGWVYQYYNDPADRKKMREGSQAPRNSRELAVRNQFFTPRYVVEFLTDNTLGRIWYEMRRGDTRFVDDCRYLVRRKRTVFLSPREEPPVPFVAGFVATVPNLPGEMWIRPNPALADNLAAIWEYSLTVDGYIYARAHLGTECDSLANSRLKKYQETKNWDGSFEELRCCLFYEQHRYHQLGQFVSDPQGEDLAAIQALFRAICERWGLETEFVSFRAKKDPRDLKILDPACGSGHFLLYSFDLLETMYVEAWNDEASPASEVTGKALRHDYPDLGQLRRVVPGLILRYNLHGLDIDPRACQIVALALWLRAQRSYQRLGLKPNERPPLTKGNVVIAEPMPGERDLIDQFVSSVSPPLIGGLVKLVFDKMQLAGEVGALLKIEEELHDVIRSAKAAWERKPRAQQLTLFPDIECRQGEQAPLFDLAGITDDAFWLQVEQRVLMALADYTMEATNGSATHRRLFAEDAAQGFAFVDRCRERYDVVLVNPPFGDPIPHSKPYIDETFPNSKGNLYSAFVERCLQWVMPRGALGAITSRSGFFLSSFRRWREKIILSQSSSLVCADLGYGVLDGAKVETAAYCLLKSEAVPSHDTGARLSVFIRLITSDDSSRESQLLFRVRQARQEVGSTEHYVVAYDDFHELPGSPFIYWVSGSIRRMFRDLPLLSEGDRSLRQGLATAYDFRFIRTAWEVEPSHVLCGKMQPDKAFAPDRETSGHPSVNQSIWAPIVKGGSYSPFHCTIDLVVNWRDNGREIRERTNSETARPYSNIWQLKGTEAQFFFKAGITWPSRPWKRGFFSHVPPGCLFSHTGTMLFVASEVHWSTLALLNSDAFIGLLHLLMPRGGGDTQQTLQYEVGYVASVPIPTIGGNEAAQLESLARRAWDISRRLSSMKETSHEFRFPAILQVEGNSLYERVMSYENKRSELVREYRAIEEKINKASYTAYDFSEADQRAIDGFLLGMDATSDRGRLVYDRKESSEDPLIKATYAKSAAVDLVSYSVGCALGRWDVRLADMNDEDFELGDPSQSVNILPLGLRAHTMPDIRAGSSHEIAVNYPLTVRTDVILVDDPSHPDDIVRAVREVLQFIWEERTVSVEQEIETVLGSVELRHFFRKFGQFFAGHLAEYSRGQRQAPIYWPLSTVSGGYTLWVYYHRLTSETLYTAVNKYVSPKISVVERDLREMEAKLTEASGREATRLREQVESTRAFLVELRDFRDELLRVAALPYRPNLDDGVIINAAPLHKLFRLPKWAKDTKECWEKLQRGDYDWAHLAYAIWPDRVREKCRHDRSLAIAHGLEELYQEPVAPARQRARRRGTGEAEESEN